MENEQHLNLKAGGQEDFEKEIKESLLMIKHFRNGYMACIEHIRQKNDKGNGDVIDIAIHNMTVTLERKLNEKVQTLLS